MKWYKNMTEQQGKDFKKVIAVSVIGAIMVYLSPWLFVLFRAMALNFTDGTR